MQEWGWHGNCGATGLCWEEDSEGVDGCCTSLSLIPWECCGASWAVITPDSLLCENTLQEAWHSLSIAPSPRGSFPRGSPAARLWDSLYPQGSKTTVACSALPLSPETSSAPDVPLSSSLIFRAT